MAAVFRGNFFRVVGVAISRGNLASAVEVAISKENCSRVVGVAISREHLGRPNLSGGLSGWVCGSGLSGVAEAAANARRPGGSGALEAPRGAHHSVLSARLNPYAFRPRNAYDVVVAYMRV